jgi:cytochrome bd-type quinol oxidase subunit 2
MRRFCFHIGTIVILILLLAVCFAALRESNETWDSSIFSLTLGVILISVLLAIHRTEQRRAFWLGFALFGSAYLGLSLLPSIEPRLITTKVLTFLDSKVPRSSPAGAGIAYFDYGWDWQPGWWGGMTILCPRKAGCRRERGHRL